MLRFSCLVLATLALVFATAVIAQPTAQYKYFRIGSPQDAATKPQPGFALMGGGADLDEAFRWMCNRANGGDFLVLRARGTDAYNPYVHSLCHENSVATLLIPDRKTAFDEAVRTRIANASTIFIS